MAYHHQSCLNRGMERFATQQIRPHDRVDHWRAAVQRTFARIGVDPERPRQLEAEVAWCDVGQSRIVLTSGSAQTVWRSAAMIDEDSAAHIILMAQKRGRASLLHRGRSVSLAPGTVIAMDTLSPYRLSFHEPFEQHILRFPIRALSRGDQDLTRLTGVPLPSSYAQSLLLAGLASAAQFGRVDAGLEAPLQELACLALAAPGTDMSASAPSDRLAQARCYIRAHLRQPELSPQQVADALGISLRSLYTLFAAADDHPAACIVRERLHQARLMLERPEARYRTVASVAANCGFLDASHFSRAFRRQFGLTPRACRELALGNRDPVTH